MKTSVAFFVEVCTIAQNLLPLLASIALSKIMIRRYCLRDVRKIGPGSELHISGRCSDCGTFLLARLDDKEAKSPTQEQLREALEIVFERHLSLEHPTSLEPQRATENIVLSLQRD